MAYTSIFKTQEDKAARRGYVSIFKEEEEKEETPVFSTPQVKYPDLADVGWKDIGREALNIIKSPFKKISDQYKEKRDKTSEDKEKEQALRNISGLEGEVFRKKEEEKMKLGNSSVTYEELEDFSKKQEEKAEKTAKVFIAPVRYTAGELAKAVTSVSLEKIDSDLSFDPRTDTEKLLVGEDRIQRLTKQEDMYGMIARGAGVPAALIAMVIIENPFLKETGISTLIKTSIKRRMKREANEQIIRLGAKELSNIVDDVIAKELKAGRITEEQAARATGEVAKMKKAPVTEKIADDLVMTPTEAIKAQATVKAVDPLTQQAKNFNNVDDFVKAKEKDIVYHGSKVPLDKFDNKQGGVFFTDNYADATGFGSPDNVYEGFLNFKKPLVIDAKGAKWDELNTKFGKSTQEVVGNAKKAGYDGVTFKNVVDNIGDTADWGGQSTIHYAIKPQDSFINESQLTDIFNKAKGVEQGVKKAPATKATKFVADAEVKRTAKIIDDSIIHLPETNEYIKIPANLTDAQKAKLFKEVENIKFDKDQAVHLSKASLAPKLTEIKAEDAIAKYANVRETLKNITEKINAEQVAAIPKTSIPKASQRISNETIEKGLIKDFGALPERDIIRTKDQARLVGEIIDKNPKEAIDIALGKKLPTNGALPESVFIAVKNQAIKNGDYKLLRRLAIEPGGVAREASTLGARIKMLDEGGGMQDDAFKRINKLVKDRKAKFQKKGKSVSKAKKAEARKIKEKIRKPDRYDWETFVKNIEC